MSSQFEDLFKARKEEKTRPKKQKGSSKKLLPTPPLKTKKIEDISKAKSKNLEFEQTLIYIKKDTKKEIKKSLLDDTSGKDFSDLVEQLLTEWLSKK